jgi:hypothetical protein
MYTPCAHTIDLPPAIRAARITFPSPNIDTIVFREKVLGDSKSVLSLPVVDHEGKKKIANARDFDDHVMPRALVRARGDGGHCAISVRRP